MTFAREQRSNSLNDTRTCRDNQLLVYTAVTLCTNVRPFGLAHEGSHPGRSEFTDCVQRTKEAKPLVKIHLLARGVAEEACNKVSECALLHDVRESR